MKTLEEYKLDFALKENITPSSKAESLIYELIREMANDKNSSKFREDVTKIMVGLRPSDGKLGYDDDFQAIEVKPVNTNGKDKLNGKGNFSDLTWTRHRKYIKDEVTMLASGFKDGKLLYIVEFPYSSIKDRMEKYLLDHLPDGDIPKKYVRSAQFSYLDWKDGDYEVKYVRHNIAQYKKVINKKFFKLLMFTVKNDSEFFEYKKQFTWANRRRI